MSNLKEEAQEIIEELKISRQSLIERIRSIRADIEENTAAKNAAYKEGDLRENAAYTVAVENISRLNVALANAMEKMRVFDTFINEAAEYESSGFVSKGSTVKLQKIDKAGSQTYTFMIVPAEIGSAEIKALGEDTPVGKKILGKDKNKEFFVQTPSGQIKYKVVEIY